MVKDSAFHFTCVCGIKTVSKSRDGVCSNCGRAYEICWNDPPMEKQVVDFGKEPKV